MTDAAPGRPPAKPADPLRIPRALRSTVDPVLEWIDGFCATQLDEEYARLSRKMTAKLARKRPSPLLRGDLRIWAASIVYTVGQVNFLNDPTQTPHLTAEQFSEVSSVPKSSLANKARLIRDTLNTGQFDPEFCRRDLLARNPLAWIIEVDGLLVDARMLPPGLQAEARRRGLIPDLGSDTEEQGPATSTPPFTGPGGLV